MTAYFDIENLESYLAQPKNEAFDDSLKMIKKQLDLSFNFPRKNLKNQRLYCSLLRHYPRALAIKK